MQGKVVDVNVQPTGSTASVAAAVSATTLNLYDTADFDEAGGQFIDSSGNIGTYTTKDDDLQTLTTMALAVAIPIDDMVQPYPMSEEKWALVTSDEEEDGVLCLVPYSMQAIFDEGIREEYDQETVDFEHVDEQWQITNIVADIPVISGEIIETADGSPLVPSDPPSFSPAILKVTGNNSGMLVEVDSFESGNEYELHMSTTAGFGAVAGNPATLLTTTRSLVVGVKKLPDNSDLDKDTVYYFQTIAVNGLGSATPSAEMSGQMDMANISTVAVDAVSSGFGLFGSIDIGNDMHLDSDTGFTIDAPAGGNILNFPLNGDPLSLTAEVDAQRLTVEDNLILNGSGVVNASLGLGNGVAAPTTQPTLGSKINSTPGGGSNMFGDGTSDGTGFNSGLIEKPGSTTDLAFVSTLFGSNVRFANKLTGAWGGDLPTGTWNSQFYGWGGLTYCATPPSGAASYYILGSDNNRSGNVYIYRINASTGAWISELFIGTSTVFGGHHPRLVSNGTHIAMVWAPNNGSLMMRWFNGNTWAQIGSDLTVESAGTFPTGGSSISGAYYGAADIGAETLWVAMRDAGSSFTKVRACIGAASAPTPPTGLFPSAPIREFTRGGKMLGLTWDSANSRFTGYSTVGVLYRHGQYTQDKSIKAEQAWYDPTGTTHETNVGPQRTFTLPCRTSLVVTGGSPPDAALTPAGDLATATKVYCSDDGGTNWKPFILTATPYSTSVDTLVGLANGTPNTGAAFPAGSPGNLKSVVTDAGVDSITQKIFLDGSGAFRLGPYTGIRHYGRYCRGTDQGSIANNTQTAIAFNTATGGVAATGLSFSSNAFTIAKAGMYLIILNVRWDESTGSATGRRGINVQVNGTNMAQVDANDTGATNPYGQELVFMVPLAAGDTVTAGCLQNSGGNKTIVADAARTFFSCGFIGV